MAVQDGITLGSEFQLPDCTKVIGTECDYRARAWGHQVVCSFKEGESPNEGKNKN